MSGNDFNTVDLLVWMLSIIATIIGGVLIMRFEDFEIITRIILAVLVVLAYGLMFGIPALAGQPIF